MSSFLLCCVFQRNSTQVSTLLSSHVRFFAWPRTSVQLHSHSFGYRLVNFFEGNSDTPRQQTEQISGNVEIYPKYTDTGRFRLNTLQEGEWTIYRLTISSTDFCLCISSVATSVSSNIFVVLTCVHSVAPFQTLHEMTRPLTPVTSSTLTFMTQNCWKFTVSCLFPLSVWNVWIDLYTAVCVAFAFMWCGVKSEGLSTSEMLKCRLLPRLSRSPTEDRV